jgi:DNA mismatch repair protein MutL
MGSIERLPEDLANQIAAGEVVERPSSVVKELVENAMDAGATRVRIETEGGGVALVRVSDDGSGMTAEDALLSVERHATSKLRRLEDLQSIGTYGFRGEALPSIASVSRFTLRTRRHEDLEGTEIAIAGGGGIERRPSGGAAGTTVEVRELFFNVPARRKFLRSLATESAHVTEVALAAALARPDLAVTLTRESKVVREWLRAASREERVRAVFAADALSCCRGTRGPLGAEAYLGKPEQSRAAASALLLFVNGRIIRDRSLVRAVAQAYGNVLAPGRYPAGVVYLDLDPGLVDVNVHPQKAEVRFADGRAVGEALFRILADELAHAFGMPPAKRVGVGALRAPAPPAEAAAAEAWVFSPGESPAEPGGAPPPPEAAPAPGPQPYPMTEPRDVRPAFSELRFVAQLRQTYLVCEGQDGIYVLDQHASAERVTFHRLRKAYAGRDVPTQALLFPVAVEVTATDAAFIDEEHAALTQLGLDVRLIGPTTVAIHALPRLLARAQPEHILRDLIAEITRHGGRAFSHAVDLVLATMACHGSVRAGDRLSPAEAAALLTALDEVDFSGHCPHGRPILTRIGWEELERKVGRR